MSFSQPAIKVLWTRAGNQCAFPGCSQALTYDAVDAATGRTQPTPLGEQAHIRSHRRDGPRFDADFPAEDVHSYENALVLCPNHHAQVDAHGGSSYLHERAAADV